MGETARGQVLEQHWAPHPEELHSLSLGCWWQGEACPWNADKEQEDGGDELATWSVEGKREEKLGKWEGEMASGLLLGAAPKPWAFCTGASGDTAFLPVGVGVQRARAPATLSIPMSADPRLQAWGDLASVAALPCGQNAGVSPGRGTEF